MEKTRLTGRADLVGVKASGPTMAAAKGLPSARPGPQKKLLRSLTSLPPPEQYFGVGLC